LGLKRNGQRKKKETNAWPMDCVGWLVRCFAPWPLDVINSQGKMIEALGLTRLSTRVSSQPHDSRPILFSVRASQANLGRVLIRPVRRSDRWPRETVLSLRIGLLCHVRRLWSSNDDGLCKGGSRTAWERSSGGEETVRGTKGRTFFQCLS
jgi:hypothetical protein